MNGHRVTWFTPPDRPVEGNTVYIRPAPALPSADLSEAAWTTWVIAAARWHGWKCVHYRPARSARGVRTPVQGDIGAPDLLLARAGDVLCVELKTRTGRIRPEQRDWLDHLGDRHGYVWRPADAAQVLARLARTAS